MSLDHIKGAIDAHISAVEQFKNGAEQRINDLENEIVSMKDGAIAGRSMRGDNRSKSFAANAAKTIGESIETLDRHGSLRLEVKAAADLITTAQVGNTQNVGAGAPVGLAMGLQYACRSVELLGASAIEYSRFTGTQGDAAVQSAQGDVKAAVRGDWTLISQPSVTVAGYSNVSRQSLHDNQQLQRAIESVMGMSLNRAIDGMLWSGSAGLFDGFYTLSTLHQSLVFEGVADAIAEGIAAVQETGCNPTHVVISPTTWVQITTAKAQGSGEYLTGNYLGMQQPMIHGLPVILSLSVPDTRAVLIDSNNVELVVTQNPTVEIGYSGDGFIRNQAVMLIETRVAPVIKASAGVCLVVPAGNSV